MQKQEWFSTGSSGRLRLFCFPSAGAGGPMYRDWHRAAPDGVEVVPITPPGRLHRLGEASIVDFQTYVEELGRAIAGVADRPYAFFGHSLGALIAYEVARWVVPRVARAPHHLVLASCAAPDQGAAFDAGSYLQLSDHELLTALSRRYGSVFPPDEPPELLGLFASAFRDDLALASSYKHAESAPIACPISVLFGVADPLVTAASAAGWAKQTTRGFELIPVSATHAFASENFLELARIICEATWSN